MKRVYTALGPLGKKLRGVLEFDGGVTDTYLHPAKPGLDTWNVITQGTAPRFRIPPASQPQARLPTQASPDRTWSIHYYSRDTRRGSGIPGDSLLVEASFAPEGRRLLQGPRLDAAAPPPGSNVGMKNPDVARYDPTGLRSSMTTNAVSVAKSLAAHRPTHLPDDTTRRTRGVKRVTNWGYTHYLDH